jgi:hypothetical protein
MQAEVMRLRPDEPDDRSLWPPFSVLAMKIIHDDSVPVMEKTCPPLFRISIRLQQE